MPSSRAMRAFWGLMLLVSVVNIVQTLRDPEAVRFFATATAVLLAVGAVGTVVALILTAVRRLSAR